MENQETTNSNQVEARQYLSDEQLRDILSESRFFKDLSEEEVAELIGIIKSYRNEKQEEK